MRKIYPSWFAAVVFLFVSTYVNAQLTGTKTIPGDYATIEAAVADLNTQGVGTGGVVFNIAAGTFETPANDIIITASGTAANPIVFQKSGAGANPKIVRTDGGTNSTSTLGGFGDGVVRIDGGDYITFDAIDIETGDQGIEYGYYLQKPSATDACQFVTIKNCVITMSKGSSAYVAGIYASNGTVSTSSSTGVSVSANSGRTENLILTGNTISNVHAGIILRGNSSASFYDQNVVVGSVGEGNIIQNFGGGATSAAYGIYLVYQNNPTISYNTIDNAGGGGSPHGSTLYGIYHTSVSGDVVGDNNTISLSNSSSSALTYGYYNTTAVGSESFSNNTFGTCNISSTGSVYLIYASNSTVGSKVIANNRIVGPIDRTAASGTFYCYYNNGSPGSGTEIISGNNFSNVNLAGSATFYGINSTTASGHSQSYFNDTISNITGGSGTVYGINVTLANTRNIHDNIIYNLNGAGTVYGIANGSGGANELNIYNNKIYDLSSSSTGTTSGLVTGILVSSGSTNAVASIYNNLIGNLTASSASGTDAVRGFSSTSTTSTTSINLYYNTIFLEASSSGTNFGTSGVFHTTSTTATTANFTMRNNIIINKSVPNGTGVSAAYRRSSTSLSNYNDASNNNLFFVTALSSAYIFTDGTNSFNDILGYKTFISSIGAELSSVSDDIIFQSIIGSSADFLKYDLTVSNLAESGAENITGITDDYAGTIRQGNSGYTGTGNKPDIGAWELEGTLPSCTGTPIASNTVSSANPVCAGQNFILSLDQSYLGVTYQWQSSTDNVTYTDITDATSSTLLTTGPSVSTWYQCIITCSGNDRVSVPVQVVVNTAMSGSYTINSGAATGGTNYASFTEAINELVCRGVSSAVVFEVQTGSFYNEQVIIPPVPGASDVNTITFNGNAAVISDNGNTTTSERAVIKLDGADHIILDSLYINTGTGTYGFGVQLLNDADSNIIRKCVITGNTSSTSSSNFAGIVINSSASGITTTGDSQCDGNLIAGNTVIGGYAGIALVANSSTAMMNNNKIVNNIVQDFYTYGIYLNGNVNTLVEGNDISRPTRNSVTSFYAVYMSGVSLATTISKNKFHNPFDANTTSTSGAYGVNCNAADAAAGYETVISNNLVYNFNGEGTHNAFINTGSDYVKYYYNSISLEDVSATTSTTLTRGFYQTTMATGLEYKNNIIKIARGGTGAKECMYFNTATTTFVSDNNAFFNTTTSNIGYINGTTYNNLVDWQAAISGDGNSIYVDPLYISTNDLHLQPGSPVDDGGTPIPGIMTDIDGEARDASTPDIGADELPLSSGLDMKVSSLVSPAVTEGCYGVETITVKIKNNSTTAIDFAINPVTVTVNVSGAATAVLSAVLNSGTLAAGTTMDVSMTTPAATLDMSAPGAYLFDAATSVAGDVNTANDAMPQDTRTKVALTAGTVSATPGIYCSTGGTPTLTVTGADGYSGFQWQQSTSSGTGFTDIVGATTSPYTVGSAITQTMYYRLVASCGVNTQTSAEAMVELIDPQVLTTSPGTHCGPGEVTLGATGSSGTTLRWYDNPAGTDIIGTGTSFTTPVLTANTTYYVSASTNSTGPLSSTIGSGATTSATYSNPFYSLWSNTHVQHLIPASELLAAGMSAGNITSLALNVTSAGSLPMIDLSVKLGTTTATDMSAYVSTSFTTVFTSASLMPVVGINTMTFSTPFYWDGSSNLVIEICHGNPSSTATMSRTVEADNTPYISTIHTHKTSGTGGSVQCGDITTNLTTYSLRPKFIFASDPGCATALVPVLATISTPPAINASATNATICEGESTQLDVSSGNAGYTYNWNPGNLSGATQVVSPSTGTTYTVTATDNSGGVNDGCINIADVSITVNPLPAAVTINPSSVILCGSAPAELLTASGGALIGSIALSEDFNGTATGWTTVNNSTGGTPANADWILRADGYTHGSTPVTFHSNDNSQFIASNSDAQGSSSTTNADLLSPVFSLSGFTSATLSFYHFYRDLSTSQPNDSATVFISTNGGSSWDQLIMYNATTGASDGFVPATIDLTPYVGQSNVQLKFNFYATWDWYWAIDNLLITGDQPADITWSPLTGLFTDAAATTPYTGTATTTVYAKPLSTTTFTATATNTFGCSTSNTIDVTITASPSATISYAGSPYCSNGGTASVTQTGSAGGTYSSTTGLTIDASTGAIDLGASTPGTYTVTYDIAASGGCSAFSTTTDVTITVAPSATISYPGSPYCSGGSTAVVTQTGTSGGTYSSTAGLSINSTTGEIDLGTSTPGTYTVTYSIAAASGCALYTTTTPITISTSPSATISYTVSPYCSNGGTATVTQTGSAGGVYGSTTGLTIDVSTGAIDLGASTPGTYTVTYSIAAGSGCSAFSTTTSVTITPAPSATISYAGSPYCSNGGTATVTQAGTTGGAYSSTTGLSINITTGELDLSASTAGTYTVTYTVAAANGCAVYTTTTNVTITAAPSATISYAGSPYCSNGGTATVTQTGTTGGTYSSTAGLTISTTTGEIDLGTSTAGTYTVTYTVAAANGCAVYTTTTDVTITAAPSATMSYAGSPYCSNGGTAAVTETGTAGGAYSSTAGLTIDASTGAIDLGASTPGTYTVTYTVAAASGCAMFSTTTNVTITAAPNATISYAGSPYCMTAGTASVTQTGSTGGTYSSTAGLVIDATTGTITLGTSAAGTYTVTYTVAAANGCAAFSTTASVVVTATGTWTGATSTDWNTASNWCGGIPTATTDVIIPGTVPNMPDLSTGAGSARNITINTGGSLTIGAGGSLDLYGSITGGGAFTATNGSINFRGTANQAAPGFTATNVTMNGSGFTPGGNTTITGTLTLTNGNITLGSNNLTLNNSSTGSATSHIVTNGTGTVVVAGFAATQTRTVPVGSEAGNYNPVVLTANAGHITDNITVRVQTGVFENGVSGSVFLTHVANQMWVINEATPGGSNVNITLQWTGSQELTSFDRTKCYVMQHNGTQWVEGTPAAASGGDPYTQTKLNVTSFSPFAVQTQPIPQPITGIYPNPTSDYLYVVTDLQSAGSVVFSVYDSKGQLVYKKQETLGAGLSQTRLELAHLSSGVYLVKVSTRLNREFLVQRFVKTN